MRCLRPARWSACCLVAIAACGPSSPAPARRPADKAALFGDPTLVPTREGEAARMELARAGEITAALRATGWIEEVRVDVERSDTDARAPSVVVAGRRTPSSPADLDDRVRDVVAAICTREAVVTLALADAPSSDDLPEGPRELPRTVALGLALFGLGASLSLFADRAWRRRRRAITRRGGPRAPR